MSGSHILIVEDEIKIAKVLRDYLKDANYKTSWLKTGDEVVNLVRQEKPDMVLLVLNC